MSFHSINNPRSDSRAWTVEVPPTTTTTTTTTTEAAAAIPNPQPKIDVPSGDDGNTYFAFQFKIFLPDKTGEMGVGGIIGLVFGLLFGLILLGMSFFCYRCFTFSVTLCLLSSNRRPGQRVADSSRSSSKRNSGDLELESVNFVQPCFQAMRAKETPCCPLDNRLSGSLHF